MRVFARRSAIALGILIAWTAPIRAQAVRDDFPLPNGTLYALTQASGTLYVGGSFTRIGPRAAYGAVLSPAAGEIVRSPKLDGGVESAAPDGQGGWFIIGGFNNVNGLRRGGMAHIQADGAVAGWNPQRGSNVNAIAAGGSAVYAGGSFTEMNGVSRIKAAALDPVTAALLPWDPQIDVTSNGVYTIRVASGRVYLGGAFTIGGQSRQHVAAVDPVTGALLPWNPIVDGPVFAIVIGDSAVYLGGRFTRVGGAPRKNLAAVDIVTGAVTSWNPGANGDVLTLERGGSTLYAGGIFTTVAGAPRTCLAAFDLATGSLTSWNPGVTPGFVWTLATSGPTIYAGGQFSAVGGQARDNIAAIDSASGVPTEWDPGAYAPVYALVADGATVFAGGSFTSIAATKRHNLAAVDIATGNVTDWNPGANGIVRALVAGADAIVYAGGAFDTVGTRRRRQIAAIAGRTGAVMDWDPRAYGTVFSLALSGSLLYAGGNFNAIGGQPRSRIAALDLATGLATPWNPGADSTVRAIMPHGGAVFAGGSFQTIGGASRSRIAALDRFLGVATSWNAPVTGVNPDVYALAARGPVLYVGGDFTTIAGVPRECRAALDTASAAVTPWTTGASATCYALAPAGVGAGAAPEFVYAAGRGGIEVLDGGTGAHLSWYPAGYAPAYAVEFGRPDFFVGGAFGLVAATELSTPTAVPMLGADAVAPELTQVGPVPSRGRTAVAFVLPRRCHVRLRVFDIQGRVEAELVDAVLGPGPQQTVWNGRGRRGKSPSGSYFVRLEADGRSRVKRIVLNR